MHPITYQRIEFKISDLNPNLPCKSIPNELNKILASVLLESHFTILTTDLFGKSTLQQTL